MSTETIISRSHLETRARGMKPQPARRKRWIFSKWSLSIALILVIYTLVGFLLLPAIIKSQMLQRLPATTKRTVAVQQVKVNPFALSLVIRGFTLKEPNGDVFCSFDKLYVNLRLVSLFKRAFVFKEIALKKPFASVIFQQDGKFNFSNLLSALPAEIKSKLKPQEGSRFVVERLNIEEGALFFDDLNRKFLLKLSQIGLLVQGLSNQSNATVSTVLSLLCNGTGKVALQGKLLPFARSADVQVQVTDLDMRAIQPYVEEIWKLEITGGTLTANGRILVAAAGHAAPLVRFAGEVGVANFISVDTAAREEFLKLNSLRLTGLDLRYLPHGLDLTAVNVVGLRSSLFIHPDKSSNWKGMVKNAEKLHEVTVKLRLNKLFPFQIGIVSLENCSIGFADLSIEPNVVAELQAVAGSVTGLSSTEKATASVDLHGKLDGQSTLAVSGTINPLADNLKIDLVLSLNNGEMTPVSPYAAKYVGYPIQQGQLSIEARYLVNQHALKAENKVRVRQLKLGAKSNSPDATQLRVKLAVALMQDHDGLLAFDVPVSGQLDDLNFKLGPVIRQVFMNLITKAVSEPFALLGSLFGETEGLSYIAFDPGRSDFAQGEARKVDTLAKVLQERPALELQIAGSVDPVKDREALAKLNLEQQLKVRRIKEINAAANSLVSVETFQLDPNDHERLVMVAYGEASGTFVTRISASRTAQIPVSKAEADWAQMSTKGNAMFPMLYRATPLRDAEAGQQKAGEKLSHELTLADMEAKLIEEIEVTDNDFQTLIRDRGNKVQNALLQTGKVNTERLFILASKPVDPSYRGQSGVALSLQ